MPQHEVNPALKIPIKLHHFPAPLLKVYQDIKNVLSCKNPTDGAEK